MLEQAKHPYDSFVTPDYNEVTVAIGTEIQKALQGKKTAAEAMAEAASRGRRDRQEARLTRR